MKEDELSKFRERIGWKSSLEQAGSGASDAAR